MGLLRVMTRIRRYVGVNASADSQVWVITRAMQIMPKNPEPDTTLEKEIIQKTPSINK